MTAMIEFKWNGYNKTNKNVPLWPM